SIIDGLNYNNRRPSNTPIGNDYIQKFALTKYHQFLKGGLTQIEISEYDIAELQKKSGLKDIKFPNGMYIMGSLFSACGKLDRNNFQFDLRVIGGVSSVSLMTRFAHLDPNLYT